MDQALLAFWADGLAGGRPGWKATWPEGGHKGRPYKGPRDAAQPDLELRSGIWRARFFYEAPQRDLAGQIFLRGSTAKFGRPDFSMGLHSGIWRAKNFCGGPQGDLAGQIFLRSFAGR